MFRYIFFSLMLLAGLCPLSAQIGTGSQSQSLASDTTERKPVVKEPFVPKDLGLSLGIDLSPFIQKLFDNDRTGLAFIGRYGFRERWYANAELGYENIDLHSADFDYKSNGTFIRLGLDYDIFNVGKWQDNDNIFIGLRYGYSYQSHESERFEVVDSYWGNLVSSVGKNSVNSHWVETIFGLRGEMLPNFYMGWSFRARFLLASTHNGVLEPYYIAGYGLFDNKVNLGFAYTLEYQIPFKRGAKNSNRK